MLVTVEGTDTASVVSALTRQVQTLPDELMASLTWDPGLEMASHTNFTVRADVAVDFCDPKSPWAARLPREHCECVRWPRPG